MKIFDFFDLDIRKQNQSKFRKIKLLICSLLLIMSFTIISYRTISLASINKDNISNKAYQVIEKNSFQKNLRGNIYDRNNEILYLPVNIGSQNGIGVLGVSFRESRNFFEALSIGVYETYNLSIKTLQLIGKMITGNVGTENLSGPIGIAQMAGNTAQAGFLPFMYLMALLSISLGVLNLLPIPVLDGGQLTLLGIEAVRGKPFTEKTENFIYTGGALMVGALMIFAIFNDISRFL